LHADPVGDLPHGERGPKAGLLHAEHHAFEDLHALLVALADPGVHPDRVAGVEVGNVVAELVALHGFDDGVAHLPSLSGPRARIDVSMRDSLPQRLTRLPEASGPPRPASAGRRGPDADRGSARAPASASTERSARDRPTKGPPGPASPETPGASYIAGSPEAPARSSRYPPTARCPKHRARAGHMHLPHKGPRVLPPSARNRRGRAPRPRRPAPFRPRPRSARTRGRAGQARRTR